MSKDGIRAYNNDRIKVTFEAAKCTHSGQCVKGLPEVFDVNKRPWINVNGADAENIIEQVKACPSAALQYERLNEK